MGMHKDARLMQGMKATHYINDAHRQLDARSFLHIAEARLLWYLGEHDRVSRRDLEAGLSLGQSTVNRQVGACISKGLVESLEADGGRTQLIGITALGRELLDRHIAPYHDVYREALEFMDDDDQMRFLAQLEVFSQRLATAASTEHGGPEAAQG